MTDTRQRIERLRFHLSKNALWNPELADWLAGLGSIVDAMDRALDEGRPHDLGALVARMQSMLGGDAN